MNFSRNPNSKDEIDLTNQVYDEWNASIGTRQSIGIDEEWALCELGWEGNLREAIDEDDPLSNTNIIQPTIESMISDLIDENVDINCTGYTKSDSLYTSKARAMLRWTWDNNDMVLKQDDYERTKLNLGTGIWKVSYEPNYGINGLVKVDPEPIESIAVDPKITDYKKLQDADYIIQVSSRSLRYLRGKFGKRGRAVLPEASGSFTVQGLSEEDALGAEEVARNKAYLFERWTKDDDGKLRLVYMANGVILFDSANAKKYDYNKDADFSEGFYEHGLYPYVVVPNYKRKGTIYGHSDTKFLIPIQEMINDFDDQIRYNARLMGNIQVVVGLASGININSWTPTPGLRVPARDPSAFKIVQPPPIPGYITDRRNQGFREAEIVSGRPDVVEGRSTGGADAAAAVNMLQEAGNRRIKHKKKINNAAYKMLLKLVYEFCLEFYTEPQEFTDKNDNGILHYTHFNAQDLQAIPVMEPDVDEETSYQDGWKEKEGAITKRAEFNISLSMGQGLPNTKTFIYQSLIELKHADLITREEARTILKDNLGYTGFNPLNPVGAFDGPANNQFKNTSPYGPGGVGGTHIAAGSPSLAGVMPPQPTPQPNPNSVAQPQQPPQIDPQVIQLAMQLMQQSQGGQPNV